MFRCLAKPAGVYILDEPFQALDHATIQKVKDVLRDVITNHDTLIFVTHYKEEIPDFVDLEMRLA